MTGFLLIKFCVSGRQHEIYIGDMRLSVCVSVCLRPHAHTIAQTRM